MISTEKPNLSLLITQFLLPISAREALEHYLNMIFLPLSIIKAEDREVIIPFVVFHKLIQMPLILSKHLFRVIKGKQQNLNLINFTKGLTVLYSGPIEQQLSLLFSICDFNQNGRITREDIELIFKHLHYHEYNKKNKTESFTIIQDILSYTFNGKESFNINEFKDRLYLASDSIILLLIFVNKFRPFAEDNINLAYSNNKTKVKDNDINMIDFFDLLGESTENLYDYINSRFGESIYYSCTRRSFNSFKELDQFEEDLNEVMTKASSKDSEDKDNDLFKIDLLSFLPKKQMSCLKFKFEKLISLPAENINNDFPDLTQSTFDFKDNNRGESTLNSNKLSSQPLNYFHNESIIQGIMDIKGKNQLVTILFIHKDIFIYNCNNILLQIIHMNNYLISIKEKERSRDNDENKYIYPICIIPRYPCYLTHKIIICKDNEIIIPFIQKIQQTINQRNVEDNYVFGEKIWNGDNSLIFRGKTTASTKEIVAIKVISKKSLDESIIEMIETEVEVYRLIKNNPNENVINSHDIFENEYYYFIINEYLADGTLSQYLQRKPFLLKKSFNIFLNQILKSLQYIHSFGIVHRDIKTDNILLLKNTNNEIVLKLNDFGLSKIMGFTETATESCGSLSYTAPEILRKHPYSHKVDIWSVGVLMFFMWYRQLPFSDKNNDMEGISNKIQKGDYIFPQLEPIYFQRDDESIKQFIKLCLEVNVEIRPKIVDVIIN